MFWKINLTLHWSHREGRGKIKGKTSQKHKHIFISWYLNIIRKGAAWKGEVTWSRGPSSCFDPVSTIISACIYETMRLLVEWLSPQKYKYKCNNYVLIVSSIYLVNMSSPSIDCQRHCHYKHYVLNKQDWDRCVGKLAPTVVAFLAMQY